MRPELFLTVDIACFAPADRELRLLLVRRNDEPFSGDWSLPGGEIAAGEPLDAAARRVLSEATGHRGLFLEQLYTFGDPGRDPRGRAVSVSYFAILPSDVAASRQLEATRMGLSVDEAAWFPVSRLPSPLAFDHGRIASYARWRMAQKILYTPLAFYLLPDRFTMADLRAVHEMVTGEQFDPSNFSRQMLARWDLSPVPGSRDLRARRPARLFHYIGPREISGGPSGGVSAPDAFGEMHE